MQNIPLRVFYVFCKIHEASGLTATSTRMIIAAGTIDNTVTTGTGLCDGYSLESSSSGPAICSLLNS